MRYYAAAIFSTTRILPPVISTTRTRSPVSIGSLPTDVASKTFRRSWTTTRTLPVPLAGMLRYTVPSAPTALFIRSVPLAMRNFAPDGSWGEGPGYWSYATQYNVMMLAALDSALGTDYGLSTIFGFSEAGTFPLYLTGPLDRTFNFADAGAGTPRPPQLFWLARKFHRPEYAAFELAHAEPSARTALPISVVSLHGTAVESSDNLWKNLRFL